MLEQESLLEVVGQAKSFLFTIRKLKVSANFDNQVSQYLSNGHKYPIFSHNL